MTGSFLMGDDRGFLKEGIETYQTGPQDGSSQANLFSVFTSVVYDKNRVDK
jgi:hypothetical protein